MFSICGHSEREGLQLIEGGVGADEKSFSSDKVGQWSKECSWILNTGHMIWQQQSR